MRHKNIVDVFTIIYKGRQRVGFKIEGIEKFIYLSPSSIKQCTNVDINEVEILIGSKMRPEFYKKDEKMFTGEVYQEGRPIIKDFWIDCQGTIEEMRNLNTDKLKPFKVIKEVFHFHKFGKENVGFRTNDDKTIFTSANRVLGLTSLNLNEIHILEGSYISPDYYKEGEDINDGLGKEPKLCYKSGVLLKSLNLRFFGKIQEMHERFENSGPTYATGHTNSIREHEGDHSSGSWLAEAAGTDDPEVMGDVYWNLD